MSPEAPQQTGFEAGFAAPAKHRVLAACLLAALVGMAGGCRSFSPRLSSSQLKEGYTVLLPGVLGHAPWDDNVAAGLADAGVPGAIEVYDWTAGPLLMTYNIASRDAIREQGRKVAARIVDYQNRYPGRPVHLIGHSGGAATAICALEELPSDRKVTSAVLLAPGVPADYDLRRAMSHTQTGIHNFYSPYDVLLSAIYVPSRAIRTKGDILAAGAVGFHPPASVAENDREWYERQLKQHPFEAEMLEDGNLGDHFGWTNPNFVAQWVAPVIKESGPGTRRLPAPTVLGGVQTADAYYSNVVPVNAISPVSAPAPYGRYPSAPRYVDLRQVGR